jgi:hypothetical protein
MDTDLRSQLESSKQDLRVLKSFAKKGQAQNKLLNQIADTVFQRSFPNKWKITKEGITEELVADFKLSYDLYIQELSSIQSVECEAKEDELSALRSELMLQAQKTVTLEALISDRDTEIVEIRNELEKQTCDLNNIIHSGGSHSAALDPSSLSCHAPNTSTGLSGSPQEDDEDDPFAVLTFISPLRSNERSPPPIRSLSPLPSPSQMQSSTTSPLSECYSCVQHQAHIASLELKNTELTSQLGNTTALHDANEAEAAIREAEVSQLQEEVSGLKATLQQLVDSKATALEQLKDTAFVDITNKNIEISRLECTLEGLNEELRAMRIQHGARDASVLSLQEQVAEQNATIADWESKCLHLTATADTSSSSLQAATAEHDALLTKFNEAVTALATKQHTINELECAAELMTKEMASVGAHHKAELNDSSAQMTQNSEEVVRLRGELTEQN